MNFGKEKEAQMVKDLASMSQFKVGLKYKLDRVYKNDSAVRNAVQKIYAKVKNNVDDYAAFGINNETLSLINTSMQSRAISPVAQQTTLAEKNIETRDIKSIVLDVRNKSFSLIDKKLDSLYHSKKKLDAISFAQLGTIAGISFDKGQILAGEATENIAIHAKIDSNMDPAEALKAALKGREIIIAKNHDK